ncbi:MAG: NACHT domain-containing protein [Bryobacteraceae bacterium]
MTTITFYSYKGGVGRTLALANIARYLSARGKRVVALDLDFEAPGLPHKLLRHHPDLRKNIKAGAVDLIKHFLDHRDLPPSLGPYAVPVPVQAGKRAPLTLIPAGNSLDPAYWKRLTYIVWPDLLYTPDANGEYPGLPLLLDIRNRIRDEFTPDYLLIDARTGITDLGSLAISILTDKIVALFVNNEESLEGTRLVLRGVRKAPRIPDTATVEIIPVLTRIPQAKQETEIVAEALAFLNQPIDDLEARLEFPRLHVLHSDRDLELKEDLRIDALSADSPLRREYLRLCTRLFGPERPLKIAIASSEDPDATLLAAEVATYLGHSIVDANADLHVAFAWTKVPAQLPTPLRLLINDAPPPLKSAAEAQAYAKLKALQENPPAGVVCTSYLGKVALRQALELAFEFIPTTTADNAPLARYRARLASFRADWDLSGVGVAQAFAQGETLAGRLEEIYIPLRFHPTADPDKPEQGEPLTPEDLLARERSLLISGPAGAGKTTWTRYTFLKLLADERALPLLLELRRYAAESPEADLPIVDYLAQWAELDLPTLLKEAEAPTPVLLIDGWDELGGLGKKLRRHLDAFAKQFPRAKLIATSRPYGEDKPDEASRFEHLQVQPLADAEMDTLADRAYALWFPNDATQAAEHAASLKSALAASPDARALARTPLTLTMMVLISRSRPLPDRRHELYRAWIETFLNALPKRQESQGVRLCDQEWRPDDPAERFRAVRALAFRFQSQTRRAGRAVSASRAEVVRDLPWEKEKNDRFVTWLIARAGLLTDTANDRLGFVHLSIQEYLAAREIAENRQPAELPYTVTDLARNSTWWETLRLCAAHVWDTNPEHWKPVLERLVGFDERIALAGMMHADGVGDEATLASWVGQLAPAVRSAVSPPLEILAAAWRASRQESRRTKLAEDMNRYFARDNWFVWNRIHHWADASTTPFDPPPFPAVMLRAGFGHGPLEERAIACGRVWTAGDPIWPRKPQSLALLQVWPSQRRLAGMRLETAATLSIRVEDLQKPVRAALKPWKRGSGLDNSARNLASVWVHDVARDFARDLARGWARDWACGWASGWAHDVAHDSAHDLVRDKARDWARGRARGLAHGLARDWALDRTLPDHLDFVSIEAHHFSRAAARALIAHGETDTPEGHLLQAACRLSLHPNSDPRPLAQLLATYTGDPLWPALARHLTRQSTDDDRQLLIHLAQHPEERDPPLRWGLQYFIRGDIMHPDGTVTLLDDVSREFGFEPLPYLDEMPPELEI